MSRYASRKFITAMASLAVSTWALAEKLIAASDWRVVILGTVAAYIAGNVAQKALVKESAP
jgi:hypothetical protein